MSPLAAFSPAVLPEADADAGATPARNGHVRLADFSTGPRVLLISLMAVAVGAISSVIAYALIWLINIITNLAFHQVFSSFAATPMGHHLGWWVILVPVTGPGRAGDRRAQ